MLGDRRISSTSSSVVVLVWCEDSVVGVMSVVCGVNGTTTTVVAEEMVGKGATVEGTCRDEWSDPFNGFDTDISEAHLVPFLVGGRRQLLIPHTLPFVVGKVGKEERMNSDDTLKDAKN